MAKKSLKGGRFEREVSKQLSLWWTEGERDDVFWRSSQSGGRATTRAKGGKLTAGSYGDITALDSVGEPFLKYFCLELKRGYTKDTDVMALLDSNQKRPVLLQHWNQCERDRKLGGILHSLVIIKRDHMTTCCYMNIDAYLSLVKAFNKECKISSISFNNGSFDMLMFKFEDFLKIINPRKLEEVICDELHGVGD